ncbi:MAG TPA: cytochrome c [Candidatus Saccharimonadales bacterium]|nr:cytochrome c [Candidatus Saccharimonadales bacterium]
MHRPRRIPHALAAALLAAVALLALVAATPQRRAGGNSDKVARGEYLVRVTGCNDCHTPGSFYGAPDMNRKLSGSEVGWQGPWGVVCARNLTPDPETGLGRWSEADIVKALRTGMRPDGRMLAPIMPWMDFARLTDEDAGAIAAYLKTIPAVRHHVPDPLAPGAKPSIGVITFPPPPAWEVQHAGGAAGASASKQRRH